MSPATALGWFRAILEAAGLVKRLVDDEPAPECPKVAAARGKAAGKEAKRSSDATSRKMQELANADKRVVGREGLGHD